jgi:hypothetical protein
LLAIGAGQLSACRLRRDQPPRAGSEGGRLVQRAWDGEQWIKAGDNSVKWTRLPCTTFRANAVRLQLHALAYNLANFLRTPVLPGEVERWSLTSLREKVVKIGAKVIGHGRYAIFQMAEVAVPRELFGRILDRIARLRPPDPAPC